MKRFTILVVLVAVLLTGNLLAGDQQTKWQTFSDNIVTALKSDNDGLRQSALQMVIRYSDELWVHDAVFDIYQIYRHHDNEKMRQLALVALTKINSSWFNQELRDELKNETSPEIQRQIRAVLAKQQAQTI